ncbi:uncharacterized protein L969DRAFT_361121 [Mixia osmundae IAM 14324]|nr:uncharacterized protein L969DRAFT_361121 [Mixia osmundae IAM 14324]KEI40904.1 hypothetical protein L969DRAFT_361121 [Mixia osmundae IAM 14324]
MPMLVDADFPKVLISGLPVEVPFKDVKELFARFGVIVGLSRDVGVEMCEIAYVDAQSAHDAVDALNGASYFGNPLIVTTTATRTEAQTSDGRASGLRAALERLGPLRIQSTVRASEVTQSSPNSATVEKPLARNLYVLNLALDMSNLELKAIFEVYGEVLHVCVLATLDNMGRRRAFVDMESADAASKALKGLHNTIIRGHRLDCSYAIHQRDTVGAPTPAQTTYYPPTSKDGFALPRKITQNRVVPVPGQSIIARRAQLGQIQDRRPSPLAGFESAYTAWQTMPAASRSAAGEPYGSFQDGLATRLPSPQIATGFDSIADGVALGLKSLRSPRFADSSFAIGTPSNSPDRDESELSPAAAIRTILISGLSPAMVRNDEDLHKVFSKYGRIDEAILTMSEFGFATGKARVTYANTEDAAYAVTRSYELSLGGQKVLVARAAEYNHMTTDANVLVNHSSRLGQMRLSSMPSATSGLISAGVRPASSISLRAPRSPWGDVMPKSSLSAVVGHAGRDVFAPGESYFPTNFVEDQDKTPEFDGSPDSNKSAGVIGDSKLSAAAPPFFAPISARSTSQGTDGTDTSQHHDSSLSGSSMCISSSETSFFGSEASTTADVAELASGCGFPPYVLDVEKMVSDAEEKQDARDLSYDALHAKHTDSEGVSPHLEMLSIAI